MNVSRTIQWIKQAAKLRRRMAYQKAKQLQVEIDKDPFKWTKPS